MSATSGFDRFVNLMGGVEKLPRPRTKPEVEEPAAKEAEEAPQAQDLFDGLEPVDVVIARNKKFEEEFKAYRPKPNRTPVDSSSSIQPQFMPAFTQHKDITDDDLKFDSRLGEVAPRGISFSPFLAVAKLPYKFVRSEFRQPLASAFFDDSKVYNRPWDLYYCWSLHFSTAKPTIFVPEAQLQTLIDEINQAFPKADVKITDDLRADGLALNFDDLPDVLRPQWLGHSVSRDQYNYWTDNMPVPTPSHGKVPDNRSLEAYKDMIDRAIELGKNKSKAKKKVSHEAAIQRRQEYGKQTLRAERYLGLLSKAGENALPDLSTLSISALDPEKPTPHPFDQDAIFIAFDVEAYERHPKVVTEVGVATLDTRDLRGQAPGPVGKEWQKLIRARHFRVIEYKHLINKDFVQGCPDAFEFGRSELVGKDNLASVLTSCFHQPFSKETTAGSPTGAEEEKRNIILLGHDISQDIAYLNSIGFSPLNRGNLLEAMDTAVMFRSYTRDNNPTSLGKVLYHFDLEGWNLHNAGNDAVYTVWAMLATCVKNATDRGSQEVERQHAEITEKRTADAVEAAKERAKDDAEGWVTEGDGGYAIAPKQADFETRKQQAAQRPAHGPPRPEKSDTGLWTAGGVPLDV